MGLKIKEKLLRINEMKIWNSTIIKQLELLGLVIIEEIAQPKYREFRCYKDGNEFYIQYNGKGYNMDYKIAGQLELITYVYNFEGDKHEVLDVIKSILQERRN